MSDMYIGFDVGGTNTKICISDMNLHIYETAVIPTDTSGDIIDFLAGTIKKYRSKYPDIKYASLGLPGTVDPVMGTVHTAPSILVGERNIKKELSGKVGLPVSVENDVVCWAISEGVYGVCRDVRDYVFITIGTGIGSCIIIDNKIYRGADLAAGEIGYMVFLEDLKGGARGRDEFGPFESKVSASAIMNDYVALTQKEISVEEMFRQFKNPDNLVARQYISKKMDYLAVGLANIISLLHPHSLVVAGGITKEWDFLYGQLSDRLNRLISAKTRLEKSQTGDFGGAMGAIVHALKEQKIIQTQL